MFEPNFYSPLKTFSIKKVFSIICHFQQKICVHNTFQRKTLPIYFLEHVSKLLDGAKSYDMLTVLNTKFVLQRLPSPPFI